MNKLNRIVFVTLPILLLLAGCITARPSAVETPLASAKLKVVVLPFLSFAPYFIAQDEGFFAEQGLAVELIEMRQSTEAVPALIQGEIDVLGGFVNTGLLNAMYAGENVKIVADKGHFAADDCGADAFVVRSGLTEDELFTQPTGLRFSANPASIEGYLVDQLLLANGLSPERATLELIANPAAELEALQQGAVDIGLVSEPWVTQIADAGAGYLWQPIGKTVPEFQSAALFFGPNLLEDNPALGERFMIAYLKGVRQFLEGKTARNLAILAKATGLEKTLLETICWNTFHGDGAINRQSIADFAAWAVDKGYLDGMVDEATFWDGRFIAAANRAIEGEAK